MRNLRLVAVVAASCVALVFAGCKPSARCSKNADCATGQVCADGACTTPATGNGGGSGGGTAAGGGMASGGGMAMGGGTGAGGGAATGGGDATGGGGTAPTGENCASPFQIASTSFVETGNTADAGNDFTTTAGHGCVGNANLYSTSGDQVYRVSVPAGERLLATLDSPNFDAVLSVILGEANCGMSDPDGGVKTLGMECAASADRPNPTTLKFKNDGGTPLETFLLVDGRTDGGGEYTLYVDVGPTPEGDLCENPTALTPGATLSNQGLAPGAGFAGDYTGPGPGSTCSSSPGSSPQSAGLDRVYSLMVPAGQQAEITVTPSATLNASIGLAVDAAACNARTCVGWADANAEGQAEVIRWSNGSSSPQTILIIVDSGTAGGTFSISATLDSVPPGDTCSTALVPDAGTVLGSLNGLARDYRAIAGGVCRPETSGPDAVWQTEVPPGNRLTATVSAEITMMFPDGGAVYDFKPTLNLVRGSCDSPLTCVAGTVAQPFSGSTTATYDNVTSMAQSVFMIVDTAGVPMTGTYTLTTSVEPYGLPEGDACNNVGPAITTDTVLTAQPLTGYSSNWDLATPNTGCEFHNGPDRVYSVTVPPSGRLVASATSFDNLLLSIVDGPADMCTDSPVVCAVSDNRDSGSGTETVRFDNLTAAARTVFVIVDRDGDRNGTRLFDLNISLTPVISGGESCTAPVTMGANTTVLSNTQGLTSDYAFARLNDCIVSSTASDAVFTATIPPMSDYVVEANAAWDIVLNVLAAPVANCGGSMGAGSVCLAGSNARARGIESVTLKNSTASPLTIFIVVDGYDDAATGPFELTISSRPFPFVITPLAAQCTDMSGAIDMPDALGDDVNTGIQLLPFEMNFIGSAVTHFSIASNGFAQLWSSEFGTPSHDLGNTSFPNDTEPNGMVAPLWDDLVSAVDSTVKVITTGTAPNRVFTIEWGNFSFYMSMARVTFQTQLFETSNVIEYHYCNLVANGDTDRASGGSATIGAESLDGTRGMTNSVDTAGSVSTGQALRLTPQ